jgi:NADH-quinone oxidoreductase subunit L
MTHAFFKALLFMAAGSVISAMAGIQNLDRMGGFRRSMPFTFACFIIGGLALSGVPPFAGFFSKDEILAFAAHRGGIYWIFTIGGYAGALLTAFYAFRIIFRVFWGEPVPEARELEQGHLAHAEPANPATGEAEDTEIGFPGPGHYIAERATPMKIAMGTLGFLATIAGVLQIPGLTDVVDTFLEPTFEDSPLSQIQPSDSAAYIGLAVGAAMATLGIATAYYMYVVAPGTTDRIRARADAVYEFLLHKWYFDELYDAVVYRPLIALGNFANSVFERVVVQGIVNGTVAAVRGVGVVIRDAQSGFVRAYALLLVGGFAAIGLYFLIVSS